METKYKTIPFDVNRINEEGVKVLTRDGRNARILCTDVKNIKPIVAVVALIDGEGEDVLLYNANGTMCEGVASDIDLSLKMKVKSRRMTNQELAWWLRDCPEEHREAKCNFLKTDALIYHTYEYDEDETNNECSEYVLIRRNGGAWEEPLVEES